MTGGLIAMDLWSWAARCLGSAETWTVLRICVRMHVGLCWALAGGEADSELSSSYLYIRQANLAALKLFEI